MDSHQIHPFPEAVKILVVKEKLGDELADAGVHLVLQVFHIPYQAA